MDNVVPKKFGWIKDSSDIRDHIRSRLNINEESKHKKRPSIVDLRIGCPPVKAQGELGSCTANALVNAIEYLENKDENFVDFSRLFLYYNERHLLGTEDQDSGATIRDGMKSLANQGICKEQTWPYIIENFAVKPPANAYIEARDYVITSYERLTSIEDMKDCLLEGFPFVFGIKVFDSLTTEEVASTGIAKMPVENDKFLGGHAICCVGYDDVKQHFIIKNSWGKDWGKDGYFFLPYDYVKVDELSADFWSIKVTKNLPIENQNEEIQIPNPEIKIQDSSGIISVTIKKEPIIDEKSEEIIEK
jgi:C1A family cysteine protease